MVVFRFHDNVALTAFACSAALLLEIDVTAYAYIWPSLCCMALSASDFMRCTAAVSPDMYAAVCLCGLRKEEWVGPEEGWMRWWYLALMLSVAAALFTAACIIHYRGRGNVILK